MLRRVHNRETILADKNVLVVDDDMRNVFSLMQVLEKEGLRVLAAANGREGIECLQSNPDIDMVLMDIMMPETPNDQRPKLLVVDDNEHNIAAMVKLLNGFDAEIFTVRSGNQALSLLLRHEFALVLLDVQMPGRDPGA